MICLQQIRDKEHYGICSLFNKWAWRKNWNTVNFTSTLNFAYFTIQKNHTTFILKFSLALQTIYRKSDGASADPEAKKKHHKYQLTSPNDRIVYNFPITHNFILLPNNVDFIKHRRLLSSEKPSVKRKISVFAGTTSMNRAENEVKSTPNRRTIINNTPPHL